MKLATHDPYEKVMCMTYPFGKARPRVPSGMSLIEVFMYPHQENLCLKLICLTLLWQSGDSVTHPNQSDSSSEYIQSIMFHLK